MGFAGAHLLAAGSDRGRVVPEDGGKGGRSRSSNRFLMGGGGRPRTPLDGEGNDSRRFRPAGFGGSCEPSGGCGGKPFPAGVPCRTRRVTGNIAGGQESVEGLGK